MAQGFYTLEEAADVLGVAADELNRMAQRREIRAFADRGTWRFRTQDVEDVAKQRGSGSPKPKTKTGGGPSPTPPGPASSFDDDLIPMDEDIFGGGGSSGGDISFGDEDAVALGGDLPMSGSGSKPPSSGSKKPDSDVRLVLEKGSFDFDLTTESSGRVGEEPSAARRKTTANPGPAGMSSGRLGGGGDSDVRLDFDLSTIDDSMISMGGPKKDSDVRLDPSDSGPKTGGLAETPLTEEIDLDAELQQADEASLRRRQEPPKTRPVPPGKTRAVPPPKGTMLPTSSPFELSESDLDMGSSDFGSQDTGGSVDRPLGSEFELTLAPEDGASPLSLGDDEDVDLGGMPPRDKVGSSQRAELSGINLHDPADSGLSLEGDSSESVDFELTLDDDSSGPKTIKGKMPVDSDSEFELTLEDSSPSLGSDSGSTVEQKDIFETDFDLPALEEESASQAVALDDGDTDLESSDFDLQVDSGVLARGGDDSGSQVVQLEEEGSLSDAEIGSVDEMLLERELEEAYEEEAEIEEDEDDAVTVPAAEAEWHIIDVVALSACALFMFIAGLMSYELMRGMWGYHQSTKPGHLMVTGIAKMFTDDVKE